MNRCPFCESYHLRTVTVPGNGKITVCLNCDSVIPEAKYFTGELMQCALCGKIEKSDPQVENDWRVVELAYDIAFYVCPDHFPDKDGAEQDWVKAYRAVLLELMQKAGINTPAQD